MDLKYLTKEGSWEKNPPDLQAEVLQGKRGRLLVTIYRAGGAERIYQGKCGHGELRPLVSYGNEEPFEGLSRF